ncbi:Hsp20/alpha crystallin family protein [Pedobacter heparinus]|uniref:SHSP domain-containing protein n=1 Tax=Pedobacter heparinus (strain ATCC 13125 / DSM 2366 / CIP 104194 / JCM 7457 / NBRC 12017 / NCIMB 9290 / NRRL B-14731 / HIM 762-3) TaxID=485917 RepID=C6Y0C0_PEDHD|nr:Hsp20/alpha crystallin family protein [Pedobacter heparinus]ACU04832.1 hypothetical protein Phep_2629 [Pedobacter heparinus DSM 2366]
MKYSYRSFTFPESSDVNGIEAKYLDGVLYLDIPKYDGAKHISRKI